MQTEIKLNQILIGKSEERLKEFPDNFFDGVITDPPYEIGFMGKTAEENKQVILDPFCGSGSTLVAAEQLGINYIGIEQDSDSFLIASNRIGA